MSSARSTLQARARSAFFAVQASGRSRAVVEELGLDVAPSSPTSGSTRAPPRITSLQPAAPSPGFFAPGRTRLRAFELESGSRGPPPRANPPGTVRALRLGRGLPSPPQAEMQSVPQQFRPWCPKARVDFSIAPPPVLRWPPSRCRVSPAPQQALLLPPHRGSPGRSTARLLGARGRSCSLRPVLTPGHSVYSANVFITLVVYLN